MEVEDTPYSDFEDDELESLYQKNINMHVQETVIRRSLPVQRNLLGEVLSDQVSFYEEIKRDVSFGATHHKLNDDNLAQYIYPTNYEVRDYQFSIVQKSLYQNILCAIPTGMGKTFIASTVMLNFFRWSQTGKIIFTAPTRPLVAQQIKACLGITGIPQDQAAILLDKSRKNREEIWANKRVFFTTPQVVENDLKRGVLNPKDIVCIVFDEAHRATGSYAYTNVVKFINRFNSSYRVLALTATPGTDITGVQEVVNNLNISKIEIRTEESMDIVKYMKKRYKEKVEVGLTTEIEDIIEQLGIAITPVLKQAVELGIYDDCPPTYINAFVAMQKSQEVIANLNISEGIKWRNFFILQLLNHVGHMLKRIKIYGIRTFYNYFKNKYREFTTKYSLGKSTNKIAAGFYYHPILKTLMKNCDEYLLDARFLGHGKLEHVRDETGEFFSDNKSDSRVIIFTELRESALEIVKCIDSMDSSAIRPHIFIGQARGKEGFDEVEFTRKHKPKGRKRADRLQRMEDERLLAEEKKRENENQKLERSARRTASSEEAQISGMNQKQQKEVIQKFKNGAYNVLVCTSIGEEGLDIGEVDLIICYDTTSSPIKNIQRMGRTGRKRDGKIVLLFSSNESRKFDRAMEDYYDLQKQVGQNFVEYKKSDRILPANVQPRCKKEFIIVSAENEELNNMDDSDEVIRYATQCMLGKKSKTSKAKTKSKKIKATTEKRFFMPDNVNSEIVSASTLVNKFATNDGDSKVLKKIKREPLPIKKELLTLDALEKDSFDSLSPVKSDTEDQGNLIDEDSRMSKNILSRNLNIIMEAHLKAESQREHGSMISEDKTGNDLASNISLGEKIDIDENFASTPITRSKNQKAVMEVDYLPANNSVKKLYKSYFSDEDGILTKSEKLFFRDNYSLDHAVSIEPLPSVKKYTKISMLPHNRHIDKILNLFKHTKENNKQVTIEMNRSKCIARGVECGSIDLVEKNTLDTSVVIKKKIICSEWDKSGLSYYEKQNQNLHELLSSDSDSDF